MSTRTPPGWYPDPGHTGFGPAPERWWDGEAWSEHTRAAAAGPAAGFPPQPGFAPQASPPGKAKGPFVAAVVASVAVVLALVVGVVVVTGDDGGEKEADDPPTAVTGTAPLPDRTPTATPGGPPWEAPDPPEVTLAHGVELPLLDGWERAEGSYGAIVNTKAAYSCPLKESRCVRAGASVYVTPADGDPEAVATADIAANAASSYAEDYYGGITSREVIGTKSVRVAGQDGYLVRWKIDNEADPDAYVQSVAFPHPDGSGQMLVLRMGVDIHEDAPPVSVMDKMVAGVELGVGVDDSGSEAV